MKLKAIFILFITILFLFACRTAMEKKVVHSSSFIKNFHEGVRLKLNFDVDPAIDKFNLCLKEDPTDDAANFALAQLFLMKNDLQSAAKHTKLASESDPNNLYYQYELAFMHQELKEFEQAALIFDKLSKINLQNPEYYYGSFENWVKAGKKDKAIQTLSNLEKHLGGNPEIEIKRYHLLLSSGQDKAAIDGLLEAKKKYPNEPTIIANLVDYYIQKKQYDSGMKMLEELVNADPENGLALYMLGDMQMQIGQEQTGLKNLKQAVKKEGASLDQKMEILISIQNFKTSDPDMESLVDYMVIRYPKEAKAYSIRGDYFFKANKLEEATKSYKKAVEFNPNLFPIWNQILVLEYQNQWFDSLNVDSDKCIELFPVQPIPYFFSGVAKNQKKQYNEAIIKLKESLDLLLNDAALEAEIYGQIGEANFGLKDLENGKIFYEKAIERQPTSLILKNNYAYRLALQTNELEKAEKLIDEVLLTTSNQARFLDTKGWILFLKGKYLAAQDYFNQALAIAPNDKVIVEHFGDCAIKLGQKDRALEYWLKAKELKSTNLNLDKKIQNKVYYDPIY
jgi:tetratricopeptide (TPR) repeat protein